MKFQLFCAIVFSVGIKFSVGQSCSRTISFGNGNAGVQQFIGQIDSTCHSEQATWTIDVQQGSTVVLILANISLSDGESLSIEPSAGDYNSNSGKQINSYNNPGSRTFIFHSQADILLNSATPKKVCFTAIAAVIDSNGGRGGSAYYTNGNCGMPAWGTVAVVFFVFFFLTIMCVVTVRHLSCCCKKNQHSNCPHFAHQHATVTIPAPATVTNPPPSYDTATPPPVYKNYPIV